MKNSLKILKILPILLFIVVLASCEQSEKYDDTLTFKNGQAISQNILKVYYNAYEKINFENLQRQNLADLLSGKKSDSTVAPIKLVNKYYLKVNIFSLYQKILARVADNPKDDAIKSDLLALIEYADSLRDTNIEAQAKRAKGYVVAANFNMNKALYQTTILLRDIYQNDVFSWVKKLDSAYNYYALAVDRIPASVFDQNKLEKFIYQPYQGKDNLIKIYKLNLKQEAYEEKTKFLDKATMLLDIFNDYLTILQEQNKVSPNTEFISFGNDKLMNRLKNFNINEENIK